MFDIHKVKPVHGWREFFGEIGIIVLGVLIALTAESLIERWHWHEQVKQSREAIKEELYASAVNAWERLAITPCFRAQLHALANRLATGDGKWVGMPMPVRADRSDQFYDYAVLPAYAPPSRVYSTDSWKNVIANGSFNHMDAAEGLAFSNLFEEIGELSDLRRGEASAASRLAPLSYPRHLNDRDRADALADVAEVDRLFRLTDLVDRQYLADLSGLHLDLGSRRTIAAEREIAGRQRAFRGDCVSAKLTTFG